MARTLSDTIIISMIEAATRLAGGRGPISGSAGGGQGAHAAGAASQTQAGGPVGLESGATTDAAAMGASATPSAGAGARGGPAEHDTRSAEQIGSDFQTIYRQIEEVVKSSAEQETKAVGFGLR